MSQAPLIAHSVTEARLYLMVTPCRHCGRGPLSFSRASTIEDQAAGTVVAIDVVCACKRTDAFTFTVPGGIPGQEGGTIARINPTDKPSRIIDVAQWLTLFRMTVEEAGRETEKRHARELRLEASQCLEEALKFYDDEDNDLPPDGAFFHDVSRARMRENPEQFSRSRLINMRSRLPSQWPTGSHSASEPPG